VAFGGASRCIRHNPASPSHRTVAGVSACTPAAASACLNASDAIVGLLRAKAKRDWNAMGVDYRARDHLKVALLLPMATADVSAIKPNHDRFR
jgi:hypothetical protein